jgi:hypothetical protein
MITIEQIESRYLKRIPKKFRVNLIRYIKKPIVQNYLAKALRYELTDTDSHYLYLIGNQKATKYPGLYYITCIFIHPLTIAQVICDKADALARKG